MICPSLAPNFQHAQALRCQGVVRYRIASGAAGVPAHVSFVRPQCLHVPGGIAAPVRTALVVVREELVVASLEHVPQRRHASLLPVARLLLLKGTYGTAPTASTAVRFSFDRYALSALSSRTLNPRATDDARSGASMTESPTVLSVASAEAMTFVMVPTCACSLIQRWHFFSCCMARATSTRPKRRKQVRKEDTIRLRVTTEQKQMLTNAAERAGASLSTWLLSVGLRAAQERQGIG